MQYQSSSSGYASSANSGAYLQQGSNSRASYDDDAGPPCDCGKGCCAAGAAWRARKGL